MILFWLVSYWAPRRSQSLIATIYRAVATRMHLAASRVVIDDYDLHSTKALHSKAYRHPPSKISQGDFAHA